MYYSSSYGNYYRPKARHHFEDVKNDMEDDDGEKKQMGEISLPDIPLTEERLKFVPIRLSAKERAVLALVNSSLHVSEYTDNVDIWTHTSTKIDRIHEELNDFFRIFSGLCCAADFTQGEKLIMSRSFKDNARVFASACEIGRRNKIMNPEKMRSTYGKLMWLLQDASRPRIKEMIGFDCKIDIVTVASYLEDKKISDLLQDPNLEIATKQIVGQLTTEELNEMTNQKKNAIQSLTNKYANEHVQPDDILRVISSIDDYKSFLVSNRLPVEIMIRYLTKYFDQNDSQPPSLAITAGTSTACFSHSHKEQFVFVLQSLILWREIMGEMFRLWFLADQDLLSSDNQYRLSDTGQGMNRLQSCPHVGRAMSQILSKVQSTVGSWVGLSVVHLGDRDVPNALVFIDKYTQVTRILTPIINTIEGIDRICENQHIKSMVDEKFDGPEKLKRRILRDFFRHGFDGSGDDGGSCIDGRLTSAWNWCSRIEKKAYYDIFLLTGFTGFDGDMS